MVDIQYTETRSIKVYIHRSSPTLRGIVVLVLTKSDGLKNASSISSSETFSIRSQNSEYPWIFQVTGTNQNARKLLSTDLVNTNFRYSLFTKSCIHPLKVY